MNKLPAFTFDNPQEIKESKTHTAGKYDMEDLSLGDKIVDAEGNPIDKIGDGIPALVIDNGYIYRKGDLYVIKKSWLGEKSEVMLSADELNNIINWSKR